MVQVTSSILKYLLADDSHKVKVKMTETENEITFHLSIPHDLRHKIIGKDGKVIDSVRGYLKIVSKKFGNKNVFIKVNEV